MLNKGNLAKIVTRSLCAMVCVAVVLYCSCGNSYAEKETLKITNEMIYQKLLEMEKKQAIFEERFSQIDKRFEQIDKRFEQIDKRFEQIDRRFGQIDRRITDLREDTNRRFMELRDDMNKRFEQLFTFLWILTGIFTTLVVTVIGFAWWDRRTVVRRARDEAVDEVERKLFTKLLNALRYLAKEDSKLAEALKLHGLL